MGGGAEHGRAGRLSERVVVVGGGLAGITAALDCSAAGAEVTLVEVRRRLGGAAYSVSRDGLEVDNGQHVFLRGCTAYRGLLARIASDHLVEVQPRLRIPVLSPGRAPFVLERSDLPAPLQLTGALLRYPFLSPGRRLRAARTALALMRVRPGAHEHDFTLGAWLQRHGQDERSVAALWDLIALPALNVPAAQASLELGAFVFRRGLLATRDGGDIGFHVGTLSDIIARPAARALAAAGVRVLLGWRAQELAVEGGSLHVSGTSADGAEVLQADAVVVALPHMRAAGLIAPLLGGTADGLQRLGASPIVNLHVVYDREVCPHRFAAGVDTPVQYLFDRTGAAGAPAGCQYLAVSLSGAEEEMGMSVSSLRERYLPELRRLLPTARTANVESFTVTREHAATFRAAPGVGALRPGPAGAVPGLYLAGTYTATGWPATLEGAVLSGHAAARAALARLSLQAPPAPPPWRGASEPIARAAGLAAGATAVAA